MMVEQNNTNPSPGHCTIYSKKQKENFGLLSLVLVLPLVKGKYYSHVIVAARVATCIEQQTRLPAY
jgi:hypothetical protein